MSEPSDRPLVGLVMIVKNEARGIAETLESYLRSASVGPVGPHMRILDTGSTDGTPQIIIKWAKAHLMTAEVVSGPFENYSSARNRAMALWRYASDPAAIPRYLLMLSGDDVITGDLTRALSALPADDSFDAHYVEIDYRSADSLKFDQARIIRTDSRATFAGSTHEVLDTTNVGERLAGVTVIQDRSRVTAEQAKARWLEDLFLLRADLLAMPDNPRILFYLGQTYECLGMNYRAIEHYQFRLDVAGFHEERVQAALRIAFCWQRLGQREAAIAAFDHAFGLDPFRAEGPYYLAVELMHKGMLHEALAWSSLAAQMEMPDRKMPLQRAIYEWQAHGLCAHLARLIKNERLAKYHEMLIPTTAPYQRIAP